MFMFDPHYWLLVGPALLLALWAQMRVKSAYAAAQQMPAPLSGAAAARHVLDSAGLTNVTIEQIPGELTDHYDPREKVLRLSAAVYSSRTLAAVGIAAHEAGHALQDARNYAPLTIRNAAVPVANFGSGVGIWMVILGAFLLHSAVLVQIGIVLFAAVVFFQLVNLPVEFDASNRAKAQLVDLGIIDQQGLVTVRNVLNAAAWTYVAATLQSVMILLYLVSHSAAAAAATERYPSRTGSTRGGVARRLAVPGDRRHRCPSLTLRVCVPEDLCTQRRARACFRGSQAPPSALLATDCWMKYIPSTPSLMLG